MLGAEAIFHADLYNDDGTPGQLSREITWVWHGVGALRRPEKLQLTQ